MLDLSNLKEYADNKFDVANKTISVCDCLSVRSSVYKILGILYCELVPQFSYYCIEML